MEKNTPHCKLSVIKGLVEDDKVRATISAYDGASALGVETLEDMCSVLMALETTDFYKSMTTHGDHRIWQDVYHGKTKQGDAVYLKLTVIDDVLIVSFKEL